MHIRPRKRRAAEPWSLDDAFEIGDFDEVKKLRGSPNGRLLAVVTDYSHLTMYDSGTQVIAMVGDAEYIVDPAGDGVKIIELLIDALTLGMTRIQEALSDEPSQRQLLRRSALSHALITALIADASKADIDNDGRIEIHELRHALLHEKGIETGYQPAFQEEDWPHDFAVAKAPGKIVITCITYMGGNARMPEMLTIKSGASIAIRQNEVVTNNVATNNVSTSINGRNPIGHRRLHPICGGIVDCPSVIPLSL